MKAAERRGLLDRRKREVAALIHPWCFWKAWERVSRPLSSLSSLSADEQRVRSFFFFTSLLSNCLWGRLLVAASSLSPRQMRPSRKSDETSRPRNKLLPSFRNRAVFSPPPFLASNHGNGSLIVGNNSLREREREKSPLLSSLVSFSSLFLSDERKRDPYPLTQSNFRIERDTFFYSIPFLWETSWKRLARRIFNTAIAFLTASRELDPWLALNVIFVSSFLKRRDFDNLSKCIYSFFLFNTDKLHNIILSKRSVSISKFYETIGSQIDRNHFAPAIE